MQFDQEDITQGQSDFHSILDLRRAIKAEIIHGNFTKVIQSMQDLEKMLLTSSNIGYLFI